MPHLHNIQMIILLMMMMMMTIMIRMTMMLVTMMMMMIRIQIRKEINVLFNDALNTFYLRLYGVIHMVKDHSNSGRGNPPPPHRLLFPISSKGSFICIIPLTG